MKILVVEDNRDIAANIADFLEPKGHTLDFAYDGLTGLHLAATEHFDVIVLDLMLPGIDGITLCSRLRNDARSNIPVLMLTARDELDDKLEGFKAGADDYLVKPFSVKELEVRLEALIKRGRTLSDNSVYQIADLTFNIDTLTATRSGKMLELNPIQRKILLLLMQNTHRVVSKEELEEHIWGEDTPDNDVLRTHIYRLRNIIDKPFNTRLLHTVHGSGYRLTEPDADA